MTLDEAIMKYKSNAEYEREHGSPAYLKSEQLCKWLEELRALKEQQRPKGHWINKKPQWMPSLSMTIQDAYECSNCGEPGVHWWKRCIYCGAPMEIEEWMKPIIEGWRHDKRRNHQ